jgi:hypothetical protein
MSYIDKDRELEQMKNQLANVVDINYKRYNNEYMESAFERERDFRDSKKSEAKKKEFEAAEEASEELHRIMRGRKSFKI